ncbi:MAG: hypothetical protein J7L15_04570, partial [Clostridiales bacterium]|nr:hypothetical protein [Clostridiales bacterium]
MANLSKIKKEIIDVLKEKYSSSKNKDKILIQVNKELDLFEETEGLESKNNLETFYSIWKNNKDKVGDQNDINSWTAFALGITSKKPDGDFLPLRRAFARAGFPDVDVDFDDEKRDEVYTYIIDKYGRENVGNIGTHGQFKFKSCVTRVVKALDIANSFTKEKNSTYITDNVIKVNEILEPFPKKGLMKIRDDNGESHLIKTFKDAYEHCSDFRYYIDKYPDIKKHCENIEGGFANFAAHAAGIVVSDIPLETIAPLRKANKTPLATQFTMEQLESLGLIKFDILAISTMTVIKRTVKLIKENYDIDIDYENLDTNDENTFKLYRSGKLSGVFQCEQPGMQKTMIDIGVTSLDDVMAAISLYRPGPMESIPAYCSRKKGVTKVDYFHPSIEKYVKKFLNITYGILVYQEQIMQICNELAGFSVTDGYVMIKAIGKKIPQLMEKFEKQFVEGCVNNDVSKDIAQQYWDKFITPFASYGFNKCLDGETIVQDKISGNNYCIKDLVDKKEKIILSSYVNEEIVEDELIEAFDTGEKEIYEIKLDNGVIIRSTLDHKFLCEDLKMYTVQNILNNNLEIL